MADAIKAFFKNGYVVLVYFARKTFLKVHCTFVVSQSITFEKELFVMLCQSLVDKFTCICMGIMILDKNALTMLLLSYETYAEGSLESMHVSKFFCLILIHSDTLNFCM